MADLDIDFIRAQFTAFSDASLDGQCFFESAGGSYPCRFVTERLARFYCGRKVQPYGPFDASRVAGEEMDEARIRLAAMLGVKNDELSFGPSTSQNTYVLAQAFRRWLPKGATIVVTNQDHEANSGVWRRLEQEGFQLREWQMDPTTGHLDLEALEPLLEGASLLCYPHCSNVVGEINDVAAISAMAGRAGAVTCVDGVSYVPHGFPDVSELGADIYLFSAYKTYGPHQGIMIIRRALGEALPNQAHYFSSEDLSKRFTPAGSDHAQIAACAGMADYVDALYAQMGGAHGEPLERAKTVHDAMRSRETDLLAPLLEYLGGRNDLRLLGPRIADRRAPTVAIHCDRPGEPLAAELARHDIMAGGGDFYAVRPLKAMKINPAHGVLRLSFTHYTTAEEIDRLIEALNHIL